MTKFNSLRAANDDIRENSAIINSIEELKNFLAEQNIKKDVIERVGVSFMAKISDGTTVKLDENMLHVGESVLNLGENIFVPSEQTKALMYHTQTRAMQVLEHQLPAVATNDNQVQKAA